MVNLETYGVIFFSSSLSQMVIQKDDTLHRVAVLQLHTAQKMKFSIKDFFSKCYPIRRFLRIWSHLMKKSLMENFIFVQWEVMR